MLSIIGRFLGVDFVNVVRAAIATLALSSSALVVGYVKGRIDGAAIASANAAWIAEDLKKADGEHRDAIDDANAKAIVRTETTEAKNDEIEQKLTAPASGDDAIIVGHGWLQDLQSLK